jgi:hypothetical protein
MMNTITFEEAVNTLGELKNPEEKIQSAINFMKSSISSEGKPRFRDFWRMKKTCFELMPLETNPIKKNFFWKEYSDLLKEAHRLQEIFKEEVDFHKDQIQLAIAGIESEIHQVEKMQALQLPEFDRFPKLKDLEKKARYFEGLKEKVIALREDILGLEIRIHQKNELLDTLKKIGDQIFPEYKKTIQELTKAFEDLANRFFEKLEASDDKGYLKRDVRQYQAILKVIHISHDGYKKFRESFSNAWKQIEDWESESNNERLELKALDEELVQAVLGQLKILEENGRDLESLRELSRDVKVNIRLKENFVLLNKEIKRIEDIFLSKLKIENEKKALVEAEKRIKFESETEELVSDLKKQTEKKSRLSVEKLEDLLDVANKNLEIQADKANFLLVSHYALSLKIQIAKKNEADESKLGLLAKEAKVFHEKLRKELTGCGLDIDLATVISDLIEDSKKRLLLI